MTKNGCLECEAIMLNINYGHNQELMQKCRPLEEYAIFVDTVRKYSANNSLELKEAIDVAIDECIQKGILTDILTTQRAEVQTLILETFDKEQYEKDLVEDAKAEGALNILLTMIKKKLAKGKSIDTIAAELEETPSFIAELIEKI